LFIGRCEVLPKEGVVDMTWTCRNGYVNSIDQKESGKRAEKAVLEATGQSCSKK